MGLRGYPLGLGGRQELPYQVYSILDLEEFLRVAGGRAWVFEEEMRIVYVGPGDSYYALAARVSAQLQVVWWGETITEAEEACMLLGARRL